MITFSHFLFEGGGATAKWNTKPATKEDVLAALRAMANILELSEDELRDDLLGTARLVAIGKKDTAGDIDIALSETDFPPEETYEKVKAALSGESHWNGGSNIGSFAVPVGDKKVQVDLMFTPTKDWAKFIYHSAEGNGSKYRGVVRNLLMIDAAKYVQEPGKDVVVLDKNTGDVIARASRSVKLSTGLERLFKLAKKKVKGKGRAAPSKVTPDELEAELAVLKSEGHEVSGKFEKTADAITDPAKVVAFIFGKTVKPSDVETAEQVIQQIKKSFGAKTVAKIFKDAAKTLKDNKLPIPDELKA